MAAQGQPRIEVLLDEVIKKKASDLHIQVGLPPMIRVDGALAAVTGADPLNEEAVEALVFSILDEDQKQILLKDKELDYRDWVINRYIIQASDPFNTYIESVMN